MRKQFFLTLLLFQFSFAQVKIEREVNVVLPDSIWGADSTNFKVDIPLSEMSEECLTYLRLQNEDEALLCRTIGCPSVLDSNIFLNRYSTGIYFYQLNTASHSIADVFVDEMEHLSHCGSVKMSANGVDSMKVAVKRDLQPVLENQKDITGTDFAFFYYFDRSLNGETRSIVGKTFDLPVPESEYINSIVDARNEAQGIRSIKTGPKQKNGSNPILYDLKGRTIPKGHL